MRSFSPNPNPNTIHDIGTIIDTNNHIGFVTSHGSNSPLTFVDQFWNNANANANELIGSGYQFLLFNLGIVNALCDTNN